MIWSLKTYAALTASFLLGFLPCMFFMTASFPVDAGAFPVVVSGTIETEDVPVIVIDPGHGGFDGGAQAADGTEEKNINLAIAQILADLAKDYRVNVIMTREGDYGLYEENSSHKKQEDLQSRKKIMEEAGANLALSIHLNSYPQDTSVYGAQVFYPSEEVREMAEHVQKTMEVCLEDGRERTAMKKNDVLLMQNPPCPVLLIECGFLSNPQEAEKLKSTEYQRALAEAVWRAVSERLSIEKKESVTVIDSTNR